MKRLLILFLSMAVFAACSSDDDGANEDRILGVWYLVEINNSEALGLEMSDCMSQSSLDFQSNGTAMSEFYSETDGNCTADTGSVTWSNTGEGNYNIQLPFEGIGPQPGIVEFNQDNSRFSFYPTILASQNTSFVFERR